MNPHLTSINCTTESKSNRGMYLALAVVEPSNDTFPQAEGNPDRQNQNDSFEASSISPSISPISLRSISPRSNDSFEVISEGESVGETHEPSNDTFQQEGIRFFPDLRNQNDFFEHIPDLHDQNDSFEAEHIPDFQSQTDSIEIISEEESECELTREAFRTFFQRGFHEFSDAEHFKSIESLPGSDVSFSSIKSPTVSVSDTETIPWSEAEELGNTRFVYKNEDLSDDEIHDEVHDEIHDEVHDEDDCDALSDTPSEMKKEPSEMKRNERRRKVHIFPKKKDLQNMAKSLKKWLTNLFKKEEDEKVVHEEDEVRLTIVDFCIVALIIGALGATTYIGYRMMKSRRSRVIKPYPVVFETTMDTDIKQSKTVSVNE